MSEKEKKKLGLGGKIKRELGYMKKGAKILPKVVAKKAKQGIKNQWTNYKENLARDKKLTEATEAAEKEAYESEMIRQARIRGRNRAKQDKKPRRQGIAESLGFTDFVQGQEQTEKGKKKKKKKVTRTGDPLIFSMDSPLFEGLDQNRRENN